MDSTRSSTQLSRRQVLKGMALSGACAAIPGLLAACSSSSSSSSSNTAAGATAGIAADSNLAAKFGVAIPKAHVNLGMAPFGDHIMFAAGMARGWFEEVGITIGPHKYATIPYDQIVPLLVNKNYDVTTNFSSNALQSMGNLPQMKMFAFNDIYVGLFVLAPPKSGLKSVADLVAGGASFDAAMHQVVSQLKGKRFAIPDTGDHRPFLNAVFSLGGIEASEIGQLLTVDDSRMLLLARSGKIDFAAPEGGAQTAELLAQGWAPIVGVEDLIKGLPPGDTRGVSGVGHTGLCTTADFYNNNKETIYRLTSVMFRVIDGIKADIANKTTSMLQPILPVLESAAAVKIGVEGLRTIYGRVDPMQSFEDQAQIWVNKNNPFYYENIYGPQIEAAKRGGVLPANSDLKPSDIFIGGDVYEALAGLRSQYDALKPKAATLSGDAALLAKQAAAHYEARNYLDAYRYLKAATKS